jgi:hypothetical protein
LRDLHDSPALGASQSRVLGVEEKARVACEGVGVYSIGDGVGVQIGLLATERREDCAVIATRVVAMMGVYLCVKCEHGSVCDKV